MTAKTYLFGLKRLDVFINQKIQELSALRDMSTVIGSFDYSKERVQTSPSPDAPYTRAVERIMELEREINEEIDLFVDKKHTIIGQIQALENQKHLEILYKRYVEYKSFEDIALEMHFDYQYVLNLHGSALQEFSKKFQTCEEM